MPILFGKIEDAKDHILTGVLLVIAISLLIARHEGGLQTTRILAITTMSYLEQPLSMVRTYRTALQTNRELQRENILLLDELSRLRSTAEQNLSLKAMLDLRAEYTGSGQLIPVSIVGKNLTGYRNSLTINAGSEHGVQIGMPLVNSQGLIGRVILVAKNYSQIMPIHNTLFRTSATVQGIRAYGIVSWSGVGSELLLSYVPKTITVPIGSVIETSQHSNHFPPHIPIGMVTATVPEPGRDTQLIRVEPFVSINQISEAFVISWSFNPVVDSLNTAFGELYR